MVPFDDSFPHGLETLRGWLAAGVGGLAWDWPAIRQALETLQAEARANGHPARAEALGQLGLLAELGEGLAAEAAEGAAEIAAFCAGAVERLLHAHGAGEGCEDVADAVRRESRARWGEYLNLLDPAGASEARFLEPPVFDEPEPAEEPIALDPSALLRMLTGAATECHGFRAAEAPAWVGATSVAPATQKHLSGPTQVGPTQAPRDERPAPNPITNPEPLNLDPALREAFLLDATDLFERIEAIASEWDQAENRPERLQELGRCLHTLKGAAGSVGFADLARRVHDLEDRLDDAAAVAATLPEVLSSLEHVLRGGPFAVGDERATPPLARGEAAAVRAPGPAPPTGGAEAWIRIACGKIDELMDLASELIAGSGLWTARAAALKELADSARAARQRLFTSLDRLREQVLAQKNPDDRGATASLLNRLAEQASDLADLAEAHRAWAAPLADEGEALARSAHRLWEALQAIRVVPVRGLFQRLARVAREAADAEGRRVEVVLIGEEAGVDRSIQEKAFEPLLHIVRNAVSHGIEPAEQRLAAGKPRLGRVTLEARREGPTLVLGVRDDGRGIDYEAVAAKGRRLGLLRPGEPATVDRLNGLLFHTGFSTRSQASAVAGRGVGMDVVAREVGRLSGTIELSSRPGAGTTVTVRLPTRVALDAALVVRVAGARVALPLASIEQVLPSSAWAGAGWLSGGAVRWREETLPLLSARAVLGISATDAPACPKLLIARAAEARVALGVDAIEGPRPLVVKPVGPLLAGHPWVSGLSLAPDGELVLMLDPAGLARRRPQPAPSASVAAPRVARPARAALVVDDSISVRRSLGRQLRALGYEVEEAVDGLAALWKLRQRSYHVMISDLEMPRMDGFALLEELGREGIAATTPVVISSTRCDPETRRRALDRGARAFLAKPVTPETLAATLEPLIAEPRGGGRA
jgi:chemosensory pili system protein ChpA (sensor histidine kinase/response regulator)